MFSNFTIRARISLAFGLLVILLLVVATCGQFGNIAGRESLRATYEIQLSSAVAVGQAKYNLAIARISIDRAMLHPGAPDVKTLDLPKAEEYIQTARKAYSRYLAIPKKPDEQQLAEAVSKSFDNLVAEGIEPTLRSLEAGDTARADRITMTATRQLSLALTGDTALLDNYLLREGATNYEQFQATLRSISVASGVILAIAVTVSVACAAGLHRAISRPLAEALDACSLMAKGDLSRCIEAHGHDEMSALLQGLSAMQMGLRDTVSTVRSSSESMAAATHQIAAGNVDLSRRTESQAAALQQTAASMEELTVAVRQNSASTDNAKNLANRAMEIARTGGALMARVVEKMAKINAQSKRISTIIETIEGIAFQTNILALNAAVEAARAAEQGRGFAVVATEVRTLAQRSSNAAKEIKLLIDSAVASVAEGSALVESAGVTMTDIVQSSQKVSRILDEVAEALKEQSEGIEQVNRAVSQIDEVTQQNAALVEETTAVSVSLAEQGTTLRAAAVRFVT